MSSSRLWCMPGADSPTLYVCVCSMENSEFVLGTAERNAIAMALWCIMHSALYYNTDSGGLALLTTEINILFSLTDPCALPHPIYMLNHSWISCKADQRWILALRIHCAWFYSLSKRKVHPEWIYGVLTNHNRRGCNCKGFGLNS